MRKNRVIALIGTLTMAAAGLAAVSAGVSSKKADSVSADTVSKDARLYINLVNAPSWILNDGCHVHVYFKMGGNDVSSSAGETITPKGSSDTIYAYKSTGDYNNLWIDRKSSSYEGDGFGVGDIPWDKHVLKPNSSWNGGTWDDANYNIYYETVSSTAGGNASMYKKGTPAASGNGYYYNHSGLTLVATPTSGYHFVKWEKDGVQASTDSTYTIDSIDGDHAWKAIFEEDIAETYTVAFNNNGGSGAITSIVTEVGNSTTLPTCSFTAPFGYYFKEWNTQADGQGTPKQPGETIGNTQAKDTTLTMYAIWEEYNPSNGYWIEFFNSDRDPQRVKLTHNGESGSSSQWSAIDVPLEKDDVFKIVRYENGVIPSGQYWGTKYALSEDNKAIYNGQFVGDSESEDPNFKVNYDGNYTFYFHDYYNMDKLDVPSIIYEVTYDVNGGTKSGETYVIHPKVGKELTTATPETAGYSAPAGKQFLEWNTATDGSGNGFGVNSIVAGSENYAQGDEVTLYAIWGDSSVSNGTYLRGSWGWNASSQKTMNTNPDNVSEQMITGIALNPNEKVKVITYTDGTGTYRDAVTTSIDSESGYAQPTIDGNGNAVVSERGVFKIYVNTTTWNYHFYPLRLNYNGNGSESGSVSTAYPTDEGFTVDAAENGFIRDGYTFKGWNTAANGSGDSYAVGDPVDFSDATDNIILYAQWEAIKHSVTYVANGGEGTVPTQADVAEGSTFTVAQATGLSKEHYNFAGWSDGTKVYQAGETYTMGTSNVTLTAVWTPINYTITWLQDDGSTLREDSVAYGETPSYGANPTKGATEDYSYEFAGWTPEVVQVAGNATYTASYTSHLTSLGKAKQFAQEFLDKMDSVCKVVENPETHIQEVQTVLEDLQDAWTDMSARYTEFIGDDTAAQALLKKTGTPESTDVLEKFGWSYDYVYGKYHTALSNNDFAHREPKTFADSRLFSVNNVSSSTWVIASVAIVGIAAVGVFFIYRKRKEN